MQCLIVKYKGLLKPEKHEAIRNRVMKELVLENFLLLDDRYDYEIVDIDNAMFQEVNTNE